MLLLCVPPILVLLLLLSLTLLFIRSRGKERRDHNGDASSFYPPPVPGLNYFTILKTASSGRLPQTMMQWANDCGSSVFCMRTALNGTRTIVVGDAEVMRKVLTNKTATKPEEVYRRSKTVHNGGSSLFSENGERWYHARKSIMYAFSPRHIRRMRDVTMLKLEGFVANLDARQGKGFDVGKEMIYLTLQIICDAAFEYKMSASEQEEFLTELELVLKENRNSPIPLRWRLGRFIPKVRRSRLGSKRLYKLGERMFTSYLELENPIKGTVMDCIVNDPKYTSDKERINDMIILLLAGHDTTAYSLAWTLKELAKNPEEQSNLHANLLVTPKEERNNLKALHNVIKEGLRLHPVAALGGIRTCTQDIVAENYTKDGKSLVIPKGSRIFLSTMLTLHNPDYFVNPDTFIPSRWENPSDKAVSAYLPFLTGPRNCLGQSLAYAEMRTVLSRLCAEYEFSIENEGTSTFFMTYKPINCILSAKKL